MRSVYAETIYTGTRVVHEQFVKFQGNSIRGLGPRPAGEVTGEYAVITPAFIDAHSHIGMHRSGEPAGESESNENMDPIVVLADALDSVQMDDPALAQATEMGVLYSCVVPGSGNIIGGKSAVIRHRAKHSTDALVERAGVKAAFGYNPMSTREWKGTRPSTRMGAMAILRARLEEVKRKMQRQRQARGSKKREITFSAADELLRDLLAGRMRLRAHVHKIDDIAALLRLVDEFGLRITVEHAMDVHRPEMFQELKKRGIPVVYGPVDAFAYKVELRHADWRNIRHLLESGVQYGLMTDNPVTPSRQLFLQTRWFVRSGLSKQDAVELVSRRNAEVLGIADRLGTLARNRWASFVCWDGDPFDIANSPRAVYAEGEAVPLDQ